MPITATYGVIYPKPRLPHAVSLPAGPDDVVALQAYALSLDGGRTLYLLGPRGAGAKGTVGADGSFGLTVATSNAHLSVQSDGSCLGCALGWAASYFPALAAEYHKQYAQTEPAPLPVAVRRLGGRVALRYVEPRLVVYSFYTADHRLVEGFVAAPMTYKAVGLVYGASWSGPPSERRLGADELAVALGALPR